MYLTNEIDTKTQKKNELIWQKIVVRIVFTLSMLM